MPLPLILLGAGVLGAAAAVDHINDKAKAQQKQRLMHDEPEPHFLGENRGKNGAAKMPSDILTDTTGVKPVPGSIVCCCVFNVLDHTGIWLENNVIVELWGKGMIRAVSPERFLHDRSGSNMFVACDSKGNPLVAEQTTLRAKEKIFSEWNYDLIDNNCHRFGWYCITGEDRKISSFTDFNDALAGLHHKKIYWDKALLD
ncbi:MAG: hypothetical protein HRT35_03340 [Algicola sp.]|nr:hypothetical protein [Algicola sp.]